MTPGVSSADRQQALQAKSAMIPVLPLQTGSHFTWTWGGGCVPECVNVYTALGTIMLFRQILLK